MRNRKLRGACAWILSAAMLLQSGSGLVLASEGATTYIDTEELAGEDTADLAEDSLTDQEASPEQSGETAEITEDADMGSLVNEEPETGSDQDSMQELSSADHDTAQSEASGSVDWSELAAEELLEEENVILDLKLLAEGENMVVDGKVALQNSGDFIRLSNQDASTYETAEITITQNAGTSFDLTGTVDGKTFQGFGDADHPFKGKVIVNSSNTDIVIPINRAFFNYLDPSAEIGSGFYLRAKESMTDPLLAKEIKTNGQDADGSAGAGSTIHLTIDAALPGQDEDPTAFAGIIEKMAANTRLSLEINNRITDSTKAQMLTESGHIGFFCNEMEEGAALTIAGYSCGNGADAGNAIALPIEAKNGKAAGGLVGKMGRGAALTVSTALTLNGSITGNSTGAAAGGLVGEADDPVITLEQAVTVSGRVESTDGWNCGNSAGGYIGEVLYRGEHTVNTAPVDLTNLTINVTLGQGSHVGGLFGILNYDGENGKTLELANVSNVKVKHTGRSWQYGGVIGQYTTNSLKNTFRLHDLEVDVTAAGGTSTFGGVIGFVADAGVDQGISGASAAYVEIQDVNVTCNAGNSGNIQSACGGIVGEYGTGGSFTALSGTNRVTGDIYRKAGGAGGVLGQAKNGGALRLQGTTDLSGLTINKSGQKFGQIVGEINGLILYALGTGNGPEDPQSEYNWKFIRPAGTSLSDAGTYGEVIRLDGETLKEVKRAGTVDPATLTDEEGQKELISFDPAEHRIMIGYDARSDLRVQNKRDLVALGMIMQSGMTVDKGAYCNTYGPTSSLLNKNITMDPSAGVIDLAGTGLTGLVRDDGTQLYKGTFEGSNGEIKLAIGEAYGYFMKNGTETKAENPDGRSTDNGIGQIYWHPVIGFIPYFSGTMNNLKLSGTICYQNVPNGIDVVCGSVAGKAQSIECSNVEMAADIVVGDGLGGSGLKTMSTGGFIGMTDTKNGVITFKDCKMTGKVEHYTSCWGAYQGGYIAHVQGTDTNILFDNCTMEGQVFHNAKGWDVKNESYNIGGLIARVNTAKILKISSMVFRNAEIRSYNNSHCGGLFGYEWIKTNVEVLDTKITGSSVKNAKRGADGTETIAPGEFGGLVQYTTGYWKIGDGSEKGGISFEKGSAGEVNEFLGGGGSGMKPALLICETYRPNEYSYIEILKDGVNIEDGAVTVTLNGGNTFDDLVGKTIYYAEKNSVVSIGLTPPGADEPVLLNQQERNSWERKCLVNGAKTYTNGNTRYYYNVDYYRAKVGNSNTSVDDAGKLLLWHLGKYCQNINISNYFKIGNNITKITGNIDLRGVSYYPTAAWLDIQDAVVIFDFEKMDGFETADQAAGRIQNKRFNAGGSQHDKMHNSLFSDVTGICQVENLKLQGTFGRYDGGNAGVLIGSSIKGTDSANRSNLRIKGLELDGIRCADSSTMPLLVANIGSFISVSMENVTYNKASYEKDGTVQQVASALLGPIGSADAEGISLDFYDMALSGVKADSIFSTATFANSFMYKDTGSAGVYNFESTTPVDRVTYGQEISNGLTGATYNRNPYNKEEGTGQVWYLDTFGESDGQVYVSVNGPSATMGDFTSAGTYLPYIGHPENSDEKYHELDVNQREVLLVDGCGTYGHPWIIKDVMTPDNKRLLTGEDQMIAVMKLLDGSYKNIALKINTDLLAAKMQGQTANAEVHTGEHAADKVYMYQDEVWKEAEPNGNRYKIMEGGSRLSKEEMLAYVRNAYFVIAKDLELNVARFTGLGSDNTKGAFSGVIIGDSNARTVTLKGKAKVSTVGGLIRYSQGSVVKDLQIVLDSAEIPAGSKTADSAFFGSAIGHVIGGDNIIDNVQVSAAGTGVTISGGNAQLCSAGGFVGLVGGADSKMGGGVVFRNITAGLNSISGQDTTTEAPANTKYYWNPYVGRVLDGYACAEAVNCGGMGDNTDKNYKIPKLISGEKLQLEAHSSYNVDTDAGEMSIFRQTTTILNSAQDFWLFSAIVNAGFGTKGSEQWYKKAPDNATFIVSSDASCYGRTRIGRYDGVGTAACDAQEDEKDYWGGDDGKKHVKPSKSYLSTYVQSVSDGATAEELMYFLTYDKNGKNCRIEYGNYDLTGYGNGFRGIGQGYKKCIFKDQQYETRLRTYRMSDLDTSHQAMQGIKSGEDRPVITYQRNILEYSNDTYTVRQAGLFPQFYFSTEDAEEQAKFTCSNLVVSGRIDANVKRDTDTNRTYYGVLFGCDGWDSVAGAAFFDRVTIQDSRISNAGRAGGFWGHMQWTKPKTTRFTECSIGREGEAASGISIENATYCGGFIGYNADASRTLNFTDCRVFGMDIRDACHGGSFIGYTKGTTDIYGGASKNNILVAYGGSGERYIGGVIARSDTTLTVAASNGNPFLAENIQIDAVHNGSIYDAAGGLVGRAKTVDISNVIVRNTQIVGRQVGGLIGCLKDSTATNKIQYVQVENTDAVTKHYDGCVGGLVGITEKALNGYSILSLDNRIGFITQPNGNLYDKDSEVLNKGNTGVLEFDQLSDSCISLRKADEAYITYASLKNNSKGVTLYGDSRTGIWIGHGSQQTIRLTAVSRKGDCSSIRSIGAGGNNANVIYADYTGAAASRLEVAVKPETDIEIGTDSVVTLTGDGVGMPGNTPVRNTIITETLTGDMMKGYYGGTDTRPLDSIVAKFGPRGTDDDADSDKGLYQNRLSTYLREEDKAKYSGTDFPVLILNAATQKEITDIVNQYISLLTNADHTGTLRYDEITATTYAWENNAWTMAADPTMTVNTSTKALRINPGKYDNTKDQITILDVFYKNYAVDDAKQGYHLYIPVLVKKVMDIKFKVHTANGATGYPSAYGQAGQATLASFGENLTARFEFIYEWTVGEWRNTLANGDSLLWSFDKKIDLGDFSKLNKSDLQLTLVDLNKRGDVNSFVQTNGAVLSTEDVLDLNSLNKLETSKYETPLLCDLLELTVTEVDDGEFVETSAADASASVRVWDDKEGEYVYYRLKAENEPEGSAFYKIELDTQLDEGEILPVTEEYYLVLNCMKGSGLYNETIAPLAKSTKTVTGGKMPAKYIEVTTQDNAVYAIGDFYKIDTLTLSSTSKSGQKVMKSGENDRLDVTVTSKVEAIDNTDAFLREFEPYVDSRPVYYRFAVSMVNEESKPVNMDGDLTVRSLTIQTAGSSTTKTLNKVDDLAVAAEGFTVSVAGSTCYITLKTMGSNLIGGTISSTIQLDYPDATRLQEQFPVSSGEKGVQFKAASSLAYQEVYLDSTSMTRQRDVENKLYYMEEVAQASLTYDSYNKTKMDDDGNTSQLGINAREEAENASVLIQSRGMFDASAVAGLNRTDPKDPKYPAYLEGVLELGKKNETERKNENGTVIGKEYDAVAIGTYLEGIIISSSEGSSVDTTSPGLGLSADNKKFTFRIRLSSQQVKEILNKPILINVDFKAKTGESLEGISGGQYANYKVTLRAELKNSPDASDALTNQPSDHMIYTNAMVYKGIIGVTDVG